VSGENQCDQEDCDCLLGLIAIGVLKALREGKIEDAQKLSAFAQGSAQS
jgi:hypothetical protein